MFQAIALVMITLSCGTSPASGGLGKAESNPESKSFKDSSVLLVTIDTWRWDYIGASGQGKVKTPNLDRLAEEGTYYPKAQVPCPLTTPSHATILTGLTPYHHGIRDNAHFRLSKGIPTLGSLFSKAGYKTMAVVSGAPLRRVYGLDNGFDIYDDSGLSAEKEDSFSPSRRRGDITTNKALSLLSGVDSKRPVFLWVHYYDLHSPPTRVKPFSTMYSKDTYASAAAFVDSELGKLISFISKDRGRNWVVVVVGDHGEGLGDHGERTHGVMLYESTLEVPLIIYTSKGSLKLSRKGHPALIDIAPTLCAITGVKPPEDIDGVNLLDGIPAERRLSGESLYPEIAYGVTPVFLLRHEDKVWIKQAVQEVYDLSKDPGEMHDLIGTREGKKFAEESSRKFGDFFGSEKEGGLGKADLTPRGTDLRALRSLGYISGSIPRGRGLLKVDLRDFIVDKEEFDGALRDYMAGNYSKAEQGIKRFLAKYPRSDRGWMELGNTLVARKQFGEASKAFSRALKCDPGDAVSALNLGNIKMMRGDAVGALKLYELSLSNEEQQAEAHLNAGLILARKLNRPAEAIPHLKRFLELAPKDRDVPAVRRLLVSLEGKINSTKQH